MRTFEIEDRKKLIELIARIPVQNIISMEVETYRGSYLEGLNWDYLKYVYHKEKDVNKSPAWIDYTIAYKDSISPDSLLSDFDDILRTENDLQKEYNAKELGESINAFVNSLSKRRRYVFMARYYFSRPITDIADSLCVSKSTVNKEISAIKIGLRQKLESEGYVI